MLGLKLNHVSKRGHCCSFDSFCGHGCSTLVFLFFLLDVTFTTIGFKEILFIWSRYDLTSISIWKPWMTHAWPSRNHLEKHIDLILCIIPHSHQGVVPWHVARILRYYVSMETVACGFDALIMWRYLLIRFWSCIRHWLLFKSKY